MHKGGNGWGKGKEERELVWIEDVIGESGWPLGTGKRKREGGKKGKEERGGKE